MRSRPPRRPAALLALALGSLTGCSLVSIEFPETPLAERDVNLRVATHRFVARFTEEVRGAADSIASASEDEAIVLDALRWKIGSTVSVSVAAFQTSPRDALVDTWTYAAQMKTYFSEGAGSSLFGPDQNTAVETAAGLEARIAHLAGRFLTPVDLPPCEEFVASYAAEHPLEDLMSPRASAVEAFYAFMGIDEVEAIETVGTLGQVLSDFGSRVGILGDQLGREASWRTELFLREQGVDRPSLREDLDRFGARLERVAVVAEQTPAMLDSSLVRLQEEVAVLIEAIGEQRVAAMEALAGERAIVLEALSTERAATLEDLRRAVDGWIETSLSRVQSLTGLVILGLVALVLVLFGVPFAMGVLVGRLSGRRA